MPSLIVKKNNISIVLYNLFIYAYLLDPTGLFINLKMPALFLILIWNIVAEKNLNFRNLEFILLIYIVLFISTLNMLLNNYLYDQKLFLAYFKTFITTFVLCVDIPYKYLSKPLVGVSIIISFLTIFFTIISIHIPSLIFLFEIPPFDTIFISQIRPILGMNFYMVFHISSPIIILVLGQKFSEFLQKPSFSLLCLIILYGFTMFFSGTRANMLATVLVMGLIYLLYCFKKEHQLGKVVFLSTFFSLFTLIIVFVLLTDSSSGSSDIKNKHIESTVQLFLENNISMLLFGNGPASVFYTSGFNEYTNRTELSYLDLFRLFGIFGAVPIIFIYIYPLFGLLKKGTYESLSFFISYLAYLFIAGTNPLLIVPQGFIALIIAYNHMFKQKENENKPRIKQSRVVKYFFSKNNSRLYV